MGEYEPEDSRVITQNPSNIPIEPERTGPREEEVREEAKRDQYEKQRKQERSDHDPKAETCHVVARPRRVQLAVIEPDCFGGGQYSNSPLPIFFDRAESRIWMQVREAAHFHN